MGARGAGLKLGNHKLLTMPLDDSFVFVRAMLECAIDSQILSELLHQ